MSATLEPPTVEGLLPVRMKIRLSPAARAGFKDCSPRLRKRIVAAVLVAHLEQIDVHELLGAVEELRRIGVNLEVMMKQLNKHRLVSPDLIPRVKDLLALVEKMRGRA